MAVIPGLRSFFQSKRTLSIRETRAMKKRILKAHAILTRREFFRAGLLCLELTAISGVALRSEPLPPASGLESGRGVEFLVQDGNACRACRLLMSRFLARHRSGLAAYFPEGSKVFFAIGKKHLTIPKRTIAVGTCAECIRAKTSLYIPGCAPTEENLLEAIRNARKEFNRAGDATGLTSRLFDEPS